MIFIDLNKKRVFILAAKCGNTTIAEYLKCDLQGEYNQALISQVLHSPLFKKIFVIRNPYTRFLSGFYEDLEHNECYNNIGISFLEYVRFLNHCHNKKIKNVENLNVFYPHENKEISWGGYLNLKLPITDENGQISGHIQRQTAFIKFFFDLFKLKDISVIDLSQLSEVLELQTNEEIKNTKKYTDQQVDNSIKLCEMKKNPEYRVSCKYLYDSEIIDAIKNIYKEDFDFIDHLNRNGYSFNYQFAL